MKRLLTTLLCLLSFSSVLIAEDNSIYKMQPGHDYYIWNTHYERPLSLRSDQKSPRLVPYSSANEQQYLFTAEASSIPGYGLLKHKATGLYITASTTNSYSVLTKATAASSNEYLWRVKPGRDGYLVNRKSTDNSLGVDTGENGNEIGVWYDKAQGSDNCKFQIVEATKATLEESRKQWAVKELTNLMEYTNSEAVNTRYAQIFAKKMQNSMTSLKIMLDNLNDCTANSLMEKSQILRDSLGLMCINDVSVMLVQNDMEEMGNTFSLGINGLQFSTTYPEDSISILLRNKEGLGARVAIKEEGNYAFVMTNATLSVYRDGTLANQTEAYFVPQFTAQGEEPEWSIIRKSRLAGSQPELLSSNSEVTESQGYTIDKYGKKTRTLISMINSEMVIDEQLDLHLISEDAPLTKCVVNLANEKAWLIFDNTRPSDVVNKYLSQIRINGKTARVNENCRVVIYLNGALVMPFTPNESYFVGYEGEQFSGKEIGVGLGTCIDLKKNANHIRSFRLKRGYMATVASDKNGAGYSRVYVADHQDIEVPVLPNALYGRISSVTVKKWQYVSKKGYCSTKGSVKSVGSAIRSTWFYTWSADNSSNYDMEYIPIRQHKWWPSINDIAKHTDATACLSINEPEHSEQHNNCDCGGAINEWTACTLTPDFQRTGMRIGSPAPTDAGWLKNYIGHCNDMAYRCDFVAIHCYWGANEANDGNAWYNKLKAIYDATKRPIWITEWAYGASWTNESWPSGWSDKLEQNRWRIKDIMKKLEEAPFVERYAYYEHDTQFRNLVDWNDGHITPAGRVYRDMKSDFAYNASVQFVPVWWAPSLKTPTLKIEINEADQQLLATVTNENLDCTDVLALQRYNESTGQWEDYYVEQNREKFDEKTISYQFPLSDFNLETDQLRIYVKRTQGDEATSSGVTSGYLVNPNINTASKTSVEGWTCQRSADNGYTKATGDTYFEVWSPSAAGQHFDYYQDVTEIPNGIYELSANVFNSTNGIEGSVVNGSVVLYAQADTIQYIASVTKDSEMAESDRLTIPGILVRNGKLRVGVKNLGEMTARWAGADNFKLVRTGDISSDWERLYYTTLQEQDENTRKLRFAENNGNIYDASAFVVNSQDNRKVNYGWEVQNVEQATGESSDGASTNAYWNQWKGSAYTSTMTQDVYYLPEGLYSVNALLRGSADAKEISLTATVLNPDGEPYSNHDDGLKTATKTIVGTGNVSASDSPYKNGWIRNETDYVTVRPGDILRITMKADFTKSGWWSADDFGLSWQYTDPLVTPIVSLPDAPQLKSNQIYNLNGLHVDKVQKGIYIINGKKVFVK